MDHHKPCEITAWFLVWMCVFNLCNDYYKNRNALFFEIEKNPMTISNAHNYVIHSKFASIFCSHKNWNDFNSLLITNKSCFFFLLRFAQ